jgi:large subunit ribosomal protein L18
MDKKISRTRRAAKTRARIVRQGAARLMVHRTNLHIYAQVIDASGGKVIAKDVRATHPNGAKKEAAAVVGKRIAEKAKAAGVTEVAFDRAGFSYHGRVKALADAAREGGLKF